LWPVLVKELFNLREAGNQDASPDRRASCLLIRFVSSRLEVQAGELASDSAHRETGSLGAASDCASTRGMAGSIISTYTLPDR